MSDIIFDFPSEITKIVLLHLVPPEISHLCSINKKFNSVCTDEIFWYDVAKKYFPHLQRSEGTWYDLVKITSTPATIPVIIAPSRFRPPYPLGYILLDKFSTLQDLWTILNRFNPELIKEGETISDQIVKNSPAYTKFKYFKSYFSIFWTTEKAKHQRAIFIQEKYRLSYELSFGDAHSQVLENDYLYKIRLNDLLDNSDESIPDKSLLDSIYNFRIS